MSPKELSETNGQTDPKQNADLDVVFLLEVYHLDPAEAGDVRMLLVKVLGEVFVLYFTVINRRQGVNVSVLLRSYGVTISVIVNVVKLIIVLQLFTRIRILLQPSETAVKREDKLRYYPPVIRLF